MKLRKNICEDCCKGKRISELDEKVDIQGTEYIPFLKGDDNGKFSLGSLKDYLFKLIEEYLINNGIIRKDWVQSEPAYKLLATLPELIADRACKDEFGNNINDTYLTREAVKEYIGSIYEDLFVNNPPQILDGFITVDMLSDAVLQLLNSGGAITNFPDDEDITVKDGKLKFKDKVYDPNNYSGFGRKYLRRNMVDGVNVLTQEMISEPNQIYIIQYDYDLRGKTITIPEGCILKFEGGSLSNGIINGQETAIVNSSSKIFNGISFAGVFKVDKIDSKWFSIDMNKISSASLNTIELQSAVLLASLSKSPLYISEGTIYINTTNGDITWNGNKPSTISLYSNTCIIMSPATIIQVVGNSNITSHLFGATNSVENIQIIGGTIIGDLESHIDSGDSTDEDNHAIRLMGCKNVTIKDITLKNFYGDGILLTRDTSGLSSWEDYIENNNPSNILIDNIKCLYNRRNGISIISGHDITINNCILAYTASIKGTLPGAGLDIESDGGTGCKLYNIYIDNCKFIDNANGPEVTSKRNIAMWQQSSVTSDYIYNIHFSNCISSNQTKDSTSEFYTGTTVKNCLLENVMLQGNKEVEGTTIIRDCNTNSFAILPYNDINIINCNIQGKNSSPFLYQDGMDNASGTLTIQNCFIYSPTSFLFFNDGGSVDSANNVILISCMLDTDADTEIDINSATLYNCQITKGKRLGKYNSPGIPTIISGQNLYDSIGNIKDISGLKGLYGFNDRPYFSDGEVKENGVFRPIEKFFHKGETNPIVNEFYVVGEQFFNTTYNRWMFWEGSTWGNQDGTLTSKVTII